MERYIATFDGGNDGLKPGRWQAELNNSGYPECFGYGRTEEEAVKMVKDLLSMKGYANWYQTLPVIRRR